MLASYHFCYYFGFRFLASNKMVERVRESFVLLKTHFLVGIFTPWSFRTLVSEMGKTSSNNQTIAVHVSRFFSNIAHKCLNTFFLRRLFHDTDAQRTKCFRDFNKVLRGLAMPRKKMKLETLLEMSNDNWNDCSGFQCSAVEIN